MPETIKRLILSVQTDSKHVVFDFPEDAGVEILSPPWAAAARAHLVACADADRIMLALQAAPVPEPVGAGIKKP